MSTEQPVDPNAVEETKQQIRGLVSEITHLSRQDLDPNVFYGEFLQRVISALAAIGGAVWVRGEGRGLELAYQINLRQSFPDGDDGEDLNRHARLLHRVLSDGEELLVPPYSGAPGDDEAGNPTAYLLVLSPIRDDQNTAGVIEIFQRPTSGPAAQRGYLRFLSEMCVLVGDYLKGRRLQQLTDWQSLFTQVDRFARTVHEGLDPRTTAYTIANEGRRLIGCDRVSVAVRKGTRCVVEAVSGQDTMDTRATSVVLLGKLATAVMRSGDQLWYTGTSDDLPPQIEDAVHDYVDETHTKSVAVLPLRRPMEYVPDGDETKRKQAEEDEGEVIGTLIVEQIEDNRPPEAYAQSVEMVSEHSSLALSNAMEHQNLFLMPVWRAIGKARWLVRARTLPKTLAVLGAIVVGLLALWLVPVNFGMKATGTLQPTERFNVFNVEDGTIMTVEVGHGDTVGKEQLLATLRNSELELQIRELTGTIETTRRQAYAINRNLQKGRSDRSLNPSDRAQLESQVHQLKGQFKNLTEQMSELKRRQAGLKVHSPADGQIITWDVKNTLMRRPVAKGQVLMTVADPSKDWELELFMDESKVGHVLQSPPKDGEPWKVDYFLKSDPRNKLEGTLRVENVHGAAQMQEEYGHSVRMVVDIDRDELFRFAAENGPLPGTEVTAKVHCGKRSIGYKWFHQVFEFLQARLFF